MAGGKGRRLQPITLDVPKPLTRLNKKPLIDYVIDSISAADIKDIYVAVNYLGEQIKQYLGGRVTTIKTEGGLPFSIVQCADSIDSPFVCVSSDNLQEAETIRLVCKRFEELNLDVLHHYSHESCDRDSIVDYDTFKKIQKGQFFRTASVYRPEALHSIKEQVDRDMEGLPALSEILYLHGSSIRYLLTNRRYLGINTVEDLRTAERRLGD